ncbi:hypothetical protein Agub_g8229, partial [Astrephomene gubernaculifera]
SSRRMGAGLPLGPWAVILSFTVLIILNGVVWLAKRHKNVAMGSRRAQLTAEITFLRREAAKLNTPSTYAKCAKFQRLANAKEKELADVTAGPAVPGLAERLVMLCSAVKVLLLGAITLALWEVPVAHVLPRRALAPLGRLLAFPQGAQLAAFGGVAVAPWLLVADTATQALARAAFPQPTAEQLAAVVDAERLTKEAEATGRIRSGAAAASAATVPPGAVSSS